MKRDIRRIRNKPSTSSTKLQERPDKMKPSTYGQSPKVI